MGHPKLPLTAALLSMALVVPSLRIGWILDDYMQHTMLLGDQAGPLLQRPPHQLYEFVPDDDAWRASARAWGALPWYAAHDFKATFWRPLSSLTLYLDHLLWPDQAVLAHLHSLLWMGALTLIVAAIYRRLLPLPWVAGLATLLFAIDDAHALPAGWVANRNALVAMVFSTLGFLYHLRWRQQRRPWAAAVACAALAAGLWSSELALATTALWGAYALFCERGALRSRLLSLLPAATVAVTWRVLYVLSGHGTRGSELYTDPLQAPRAFLAALGPRMIALLQGQFTPIGAETAMFLQPAGKLTLTIVSGVLLLAGAWILRRWLAQAPKALFWLSAVLLAMLPLCAAFPHDRLLLPTSVAAFGLIAQLLADYRQRRPRALWESRPLRIVAMVLIGVHLLLAPVLLPVKTALAGTFGNTVRQAARSLSSLKPLQGRTLVFVTGPGFFFTNWAPVIRYHLGLSVPQRVRVLATTTGDVRVTRSDPYTLLLQAKDSFANAALDRLLRPADRPFHPGEIYRVSDLTVRIEAVTARGNARTIRCRFKTRLEDLPYRWAVWHGTGYQPFVLPPVGQKRSIASRRSTANGG